MVKRRFFTVLSTFLYTFTNKHVKSVCFFFFFLTFSISLFAQTDYTFVIEKPSPDNDNDVSISIFQMLAAALITDNDTLSVVSFSNNAAYLFSPLPGNTPNLIGLAGEKVLSDPLRGGRVEATAISAAINLANEQAEAWGRQGADKKLIIITGSDSAGKNPTIEQPSIFGTYIFYISIDSELEEVQTIADLTKQNDGTLHAWAIDINADEPEGSLVSLADGVFDCVRANNKKYELINAENSTIFSAGDFLFQANKVIILAKNNPKTSEVELQQNGKKVPVSLYRQSSYSVLQIGTMSKDSCTLSNGDIVTILVIKKISCIVLVVGGILVFCVVFGFVIIIKRFIINPIKTKVTENIKKKDVQFVLVLEENGEERLGIEPEVYIEVPKNKTGYQPPVSIYGIMQTMVIHELNEKKRNDVDQEYPKIIYEENNWIIQYRPRKAVQQPYFKHEDKEQSVFDQMLKGTDSKKAETVFIEEDYLEKDLVVFIDGKFTIKHIFKDDCKVKIVLKKLKSN